MVDSLAEIFRRWKIDKDVGPGGPSAGNPEPYAYGYSGLYECLFYRHRSNVRAVLEIGIGTMISDAPSTMATCAEPGYRPGASLRAWREYFQNATIFGLDIQPDTQFADEERIITRLCDSTDELQVQEVMREEAFPKEFDVIIDDASHNMTHQVATLRNFFPYVREGGIYVLEDLSDDVFKNIAEPVRGICVSVRSGT